jgi:hypothetical protein
MASTATYYHTQVRWGDIADLTEAKRYMFAVTIAIATTVRSTSTSTLRQAFGGSYCSAAAHARVFSGHSVV